MYLKLLSFYQCVFINIPVYILTTDDILQATWYSREFLYIRRFKVRYTMHHKVFKLLIRKVLNDYKNQENAP